MELARVAEVVATTPFMSLRQATVMRELMVTNRLTRVLELGFAHGVSTCYFAAIVDELGGGRVTSIDLLASEKREPRAEQLLEACGLGQYVDLIREPISFTWRIMRWLEEGRQDAFDLVYLDGGHTWDVTGYGFFLADRLLTEGGWMVFDDVHWTHAGSPHIGSSERVARMPEDYAREEQVERVFELLVKPHPSYVNCSIQGSWGFAQKRAQPTVQPSERRGWRR